MQQYTLQDLVAADSYVYMEVRKGLPGLKQAGRLVRYRLTKKLARNGYAPVKHTPSLWFRHTYDLMYYLVVNNVEIKYTRKEDADHLLKSFWGYYNITEGWTGEKYIA